MFVSKKMHDQMLRAKENEIRELQDELYKEKKENEELRKKYNESGAFKAIVTLIMNMKTATIVEKHDKIKELVRPLNQN